MQKETVINDAVHLFPYSQVEKDDSVILYGFGKVGKNYYRQIKANGYCSIKYVVDQNWEKYQSEGYPVKSPECLKNEPDVKIVLALANKSKDVFERLKLYGVDDSRIIHNDTFMGNPVYPDKVHVIETIRMSSEEADSIYGIKTYARMKKTRELLKLGGVEDRGYVRIGASNDGGYVMVEDLDDRNEKIAYSFGINNDVSWDRDMADRGYDIYMYDHTIDCLPEESESFHFFRKGIADSPECNAELDTLESFIGGNGHNDKRHMILKMDVEGAEWGFLDMVRPETLERFDQIVFELHFMLDTLMAETIETALGKLTKSHRLAHIHANNYGSVVYIDGLAYPDTLEVTMIKRDIYRECPYIGTLPGKFDSPCWKEYPDVVLGKWNV